MNDPHQPSAALQAITFAGAAPSRLDVPALRALCRQWLALCVHNEVTGLVLHRDGSLIGYLEGEAVALSEAFATMVRDLPPGSTRVVETRHCLRREFRTWSMHDRFPIETDAPAYPTPGRDLLRAMWQQPH